MDTQLLPAFLGLPLNPYLMSLAQMLLTYSFHSGGWCIYLQVEIHIKSCFKSDVFLQLHICIQKLRCIVLMHAAAYGYSLA